MRKVGTAAIALTALTGLYTLSLPASPTLAQDPFRINNAQAVGENTEAAFKDIFVDGNYKAASERLEKAVSSEPDEPLVYAMKASLAYMEEDAETFNSYASKTRETAEKLAGTNPLRGNLYTAVGYFLEGAYILQKEGTVKGTPQALNKLRLVFQHLDAAEKIAPEDPEVNLLKGYMDLMLAVNLPFADPTQAIERLEKYGSPRYLAERGIAIGHRDMKQYDKALEYINRALAETPNNPEVHYIKAQILFEQKKNEEAKEYFKTALAKPEILPKTIVQQILFDECRNQKRLDKKDRDCKGMRDKIREEPGSWGPSELPRLD
jgi:tetratricopeptide (TPR) repeat protein